MNVVVYCGANVGNQESYQESAVQIGRWIAQKKHTLVYGGGNIGLMGITADTVLSHGGKVIGVIPEFLVQREMKHEGLTKSYIVKTMSERKNKMISLGDAYIALPGGPGTLEEITEVISWGRLGRHQNPCVLYNMNQYYALLKAFYSEMVVKGFLKAEEQKRILFCDSIPEIEAALSVFDRSAG